MITEIAQKAVRHGMRLFCLFPLRKNRIMFCSQKGTQYACNPRYIYEYLYDKYGERLQYVWCLNSSSDSLTEHGGLKIVKYNSLKYYYYQMTSKVIVSNIPVPCYVPRRKKQCVIDTWHGGGAYKRFGITTPKQAALSDLSNKRIKTTEASDNTRWEMYKARYNALDTTYMLCSCKAFTDVIHEAQLIPKEACLEIGSPRNDIFFKNYKDLGGKAKKRLAINSETKVVLFAPTYRGNVKNQHLEINLDIKKCLDAVKEKWDGEWVFVYRMHIFSSSLDKDKIPSSAINASKYDEMQELLCMADVFITDYSSSQWDYALTGKPAFLFTPDLDYYMYEDRGFYTPIEDWAFPYAKSNDELAELIRNFDEEKHLKKVQRHLDLLGSCENGHATEKVCEIIAKQMKL